ARRARRLLVKTRDGVARVAVDGGAPGDEELRRLLVHADGLLNVPVLVLDDVMVRGFTPGLYDEALRAPEAASCARGTRARVRPGSSSSVTWPASAGPSAPSSPSSCRRRSGRCGRRPWAT